jgi:hypothetical protein
MDRERWFFSDSERSMGQILLWILKLCMGAKVESYKTSSEGLDKETNPYSYRTKKRSSAVIADPANRYGKQRYHSRVVGKRNKSAMINISIFLKGRRILETQIQKALVEGWG